MMREMTRLFTVETGCSRLMSSDDQQGAQLLVAYIQNVNDTNPSYSLMLLLVNSWFYVLLLLGFKLHNSIQFDILQ